MHRVTHIKTKQQQQQKTKNKKLYIHWELLLPNAAGRIRYRKRRAWREKRNGKNAWEHAQTIVLGGGMDRRGVTKKNKRKRKEKTYIKLG